MLFDTPAESGNLLIGNVTLLFILTPDRQALTVSDLSLFPRHADHFVVCNTSRT